MIFTFFKDRSSPHDIQTLFFIPALFPAMPKASVAWVLFQKTTEKAVCRLCADKLALGQTTGMWDHLALVHRIGTQGKFATQEANSAGPGRRDHQAAPRQLVQQRTPPHQLVDAIARMLIEDMRPERLALTPAFVEV